jgi:hypothetical protein
MLEGNRDEVLRLLQDSADKDEVLWLRAQAVVSVDERNRALDDLVDKKDQRISALARQILKREDEFARQLNQPPDYKFWKQSTWAGRLNKMRLFGMWLFGGALMLVFAILGASLNTKVQIQQNTTVASIKSTQTAVALYNQTVANYTAGTLQIIQTQYPTAELVTFGEINNNDYVVATPAAGAKFVAINLQFVCSLALCANPPEAELQLLMMDGHIVSYENSARPFLMGKPPMSRIAQGQTTQAWFVFEVPQNSVPDAILVITGDSETPQIINWTNP